MNPATPRALCRPTGFHVPRLPAKPTRRRRRAPSPPAPAVSEQQPELKPSPDAAAAYVQVATPDPPDPNAKEDWRAIANRFFGKVPRPKRDPNSSRKNLLRRLSHQSGSQMTSNPEKILPTARYKWTVLLEQKITQLLENKQPAQFLFDTNEHTPFRKAPAALTTQHTSPTMKMQRREQSETAAGLRAGHGSRNTDRD